MQLFRLLTLLFGLTPSVLSQPSVSEILERTAANYRNYRGVRLEVSQAIEAVGGGQSNAGQSSVSLALEPPAKLRLNYRTPLREYLVVNDGATQWLYLPKQKSWSQQSITTRFDQSEEEEPGSDEVVDLVNLLVNRYAALPKIASGMTLEGTVKLKAGSESVSCYLLRSSSTDGKIKSDYWIDRETFLIRKIHEVRKTTGENNVQMLLTSTWIWKTAEINPTLDPETFRFDPPAKTHEVETLTIPSSRGGIVFVGAKAPDFKLKDLDGTPVQLSELRGKVVLLDFWASWCPPCRQELPTIEKLYRQFRDRDVVFLGIDDEGAGVARGYLKSNKLTFPTLNDDRREVHRLYRLRAIPMILVLNREGVVVRHYLGTTSDSELRAALELAGAAR